MLQSVRWFRSIRLQLLFLFYDGAYGYTCNFEKQIEIKLLHPASTEEVTDSG
ncbi:MAG: hypothetical protein P8X89_11670 [Reinekea sp.]